MTEFFVARSWLFASRLSTQKGVARVSKAQIVSIVDDDASVRVALESLLRSLGFVAFAFESAEDFLRSPRVDDSACLITDVQMPGNSDQAKSTRTCQSDASRNDRKECGR